MDGERPPTVLIVDDDHEHTVALMRVFERAGYAVSGAENGQDALALLAERPIDLVISDLRMPRMNGLDLLRSVRAVGPQIAVIILTAFGEWTTYMEAMNCGCVDYVKKPVRRDDILLAARKALARRGIRAPQGPKTPSEQMGEVSRW